MCGARDADQHHSLGPLGVGEPRVAMVNAAVEHPGTAGPAEALSAGIRRRTGPGSYSCSNRRGRTMGPPPRIALNCDHDERKGQKGAACVKRYRSCLDMLGITAS
jgi:hypothetical protein